MRPVVSGEQLREIYPDLLKRLDDSNDKIRVVVCDALRTFFECLPKNWSRSLFEYMLKTLFVHLDDTNTEIQRGVYTALETAMSQDAATFVREAQAAAAKSVHSRQCENLARQAMSLQVEDMGDAENAVCAVNLQTGALQLRNLVFVVLMGVVYMECSQLACTAASRPHHTQGGCHLSNLRCCTCATWLEVCPLCAG